MKIYFLQSVIAVLLIHENFGELIKYFALANSGLR